jgi:CheY-like chemotaxis protein
MKKKILIVDDDHDIVTALRDRLEMLGFEAVTAHDGMSALQRLEETHPDLMLLDLQMPRMSGLEVLERMADRRLQGDRLYDLPVIIMTAFLEAETAATAIHAGVRGFVGKPFEWNYFFGIMKGVVPDHVDQPAPHHASGG